MLIVKSAFSHLPEVAYSFHILLGEIIGAPYQLQYEASEPHYRICLPSGNDILIENHFWSNGQQKTTPEAVCFAPHPYLTGENLLSIFGRQFLSIDNRHITCGIDLVADTFFMLSRWEEDDPAALDEHGRFPAEKSLAFRGDFLHRPVVNEWAALLREMLLRLGWNQSNTTRRFHLSISCDVDHPRLWWANQDRLRTLAGAVLKRNSLKEALYFTKNHLFKHQDPYDVFEEWFEHFARYNITAQFNFLGARAPQSNCWYPLNHPFTENLLHKIAANGHQIGFHPSYEAFDNQSAFQAELDSLRAISPLEIQGGRQHYLRFAAARTWLQWQAAGLKFDSTLGYPEAEGFRCGICQRFPVFDRVEKKMLPLREIPLLAMDVTLAQYRAYSPEQATTKLFELRRQVEKHQGEFTLLWHNSSWNTPFWEPWKKVFLDFISAK